MPPVARVRPLRTRLAAAVVEPRNELEIIAHQLTPAPLSGVVRVLAELLKTPEATLPAVLRDIGPELSMRVGTDPALRTQLRDAAMRWPSARAAKGVATVTAARRRIQISGASKRMKARLAERLT